MIAVELLEQRQENAAALKLKSERVGGMQEAEVILLRSEIKVIAISFKKSWPIIISTMCLDNVL